MSASLDESGFPGWIMMANLWITGSQHYPRGSRTREDTPLALSAGVPPLAAPVRASSTFGAGWTARS